ncbi:MAG: tRNA pseudouridine(38-40) synthase TruA [Nitrospirae bacterium]|nr:tRNA pseudouridine(38-40) synthase TruA [Nitrospirota bacterium]
MKQIQLTIQYDGTAFSGWQIQKNNTTVQGLLEDAVFAVTGEKARVTGASRTDAGVHAFEQVASFITKSKLEPQVFLRAINAHLPLDIRIIKSDECSPDFHPRYDAKSKTYSYLISRCGAYSVFLKRYSWQMPYQLNCSVMSNAANFLTGKHDFSSFRGSGCSAKNPIREVTEIEITESGSTDFFGFKINAPVIRIRIQANAFLRHMARNIAGTLVDIGKGRIQPEKMEEILEAKDRRAAGKTAPARGLFLEKIVY